MVTENHSLEGSQTRHLSNSNFLGAFRVTGKRVGMLVCLLGSMTAAPFQVLLAAQDNIGVRGNIVIRDFPNQVVDSVVVIVILDGSQQFSADLDKGTYVKYFNPSFVGRVVHVVIDNAEYMQLNPIEFRIDRVGRFPNDIFIRRKRAQAQEHYSNAHRLMAMDSLEKAGTEVEKSLAINPRYDSYLLRIQIVGAMLRNGIDPPARVFFWVRNLDTEETFLDLSRQQRFRVYYELGTAIAALPNVTSDESQSLYDLSIHALEKAIENRPTIFEPYQELYRIQEKAGLYSDVAGSIMLFFNRNPKLSQERVIRGFLLDWLTAIEKFTGYPEAHQTYLARVRAEPADMQMWRSFLAISSNYKRFFRQELDENARRLSLAYTLAEQILGDNP